MLNELKTGISQALDSVSGGKYDIVVEPTHQGLTEHTFYIDSTNVLITRLACNRFDFNAICDILFYLTPDDRQSFIDSMTEKLYDALELIDVDGKKTRGSNLGATVVDSVIHFSVTYDMLLRLTPDDVEKMQELKDMQLLKE